MIFDKTELKKYEEQLKTIGIKEETKQKEVLEYFYKLGKIIYNFNVNSYEEEN
jgi:hypothetical protein